MAWKIIRNSEPDFRDYHFSGICPKFDKESTVTTHCSGSVVCKTDLQKTYHPVGYKCSLLEQSKESASLCVETCPLVPEKYI